MTPVRGETTLPAVHANAGIEAAYRKQLIAMVDEMHKSVTYWLTATYREQVARVGMTSDASPANELRDTMRKLTRRWVGIFGRSAPGLAKRFAERAARQVDITMTNQLRKRDFGIEFKMTDDAQNAVSAVIGENVGLIRSIGQEYLTDVEGLVMRSIARGGDLNSLALELEKRYGITRRRASFIAMDQNHKANAAMSRVRQAGLGVVEAVWQHSHAGREPRASHVAFDGKRYVIAEGAHIDGEYIWPGEKPRCRCMSRPILPF